MTIERVVINKIYENAETIKLLGAYKNEGDGNYKNANFTIFFQKKHGAETKAYSQFRENGLDQTKDNEKIFLRNVFATRGKDYNGQEQYIIMSFDFDGIVEKEVKPVEDVSPNRNLTDDKITYPPIKEKEEVPWDLDL